MRQEDESRSALREIARRLGFVLDTEAYAFKSLWQIGHWLSINTSALKFNTLAFPMYESERLVLPFAASLMTRGSDVRMVSLDEEFNPDLNQLREACRSKRTIYVFSLASPVTGAISESVERIRTVHEMNGIAVMDASYLLPRRGIGLGGIDADITIVRSRPMLSFDGLVIAYLSRRLRDILKKDSFASSSWKTISLTDIPFEQAPVMLEALRYMEGQGYDRIRTRDLEFSRAILSRIGEIDGVSVIGPKDPLRRVAIFSLTSNQFSPEEVSLILDNAASLIVSVNSLGIREGRFSIPIPTNECVRIAPHIQNTLTDVNAFIEGIESLSSGGRTE